jgi:tRNA-2-methylthio-N6-dimethylallyladenosine synthase
MKTYHVWTIGCQMNVADAERISALLESLNLRPTDDITQADVVILNSCVVRQGAEDRVTGKLGEIKAMKRHRDMLIGLMGCMVTDATIPSLERRFPHVDVFFNVLQVDRLVRALRDRHAAGVEFGPELVAESTGFYPGFQTAYLETHPLGPTKYIPVIYGCNMACTFCIIPSRRGRERSRPLDEVTAEIRLLATRGVKEVTLLGQTVDAYGRDLSRIPRRYWVSNEPTSPIGYRPDLADLLAAVNEIPGIVRIRFLTSHPLYVSDRLIDAVAQLPKVCETINIPVQSGDDTILRAMRRGYTVDDYRRLVERIRERIPGVAITTDLIVGFPGETEEHFANSLRLIQNLEFDMVHVAAFSPRPGTVAATMPDDVPPEEKKRRLHAIEETQESILTRKHAGYVGQTVEILVEGRERGRWMGRMRNDTIVFFDDGATDWTGKLVRVHIDTASPWSLSGHVADNNPG